jgi:hypothetical protein
VGGEVLVALLVTGVLGDEVEVLAADDEGTYFPLVYSHFQILLGRLRVGSRSDKKVYVRCILVETTVPVRIRPRIETIPVKGHFLSM